MARLRIEFSLHKTAISRIEDFCPCRSLSRASSCENGVSFPSEGEERTLATAKGLALRSGLVSVPSSWRAPIRVTMASASTATDTGVPKPSSSPVPVDASPALQVIFPDQHSCVFLYLSGFGFYMFFFFCLPGFFIFEEHLPFEADTRRFLKICRTKFPGTIYLGFRVWSRF